MIQNKKTIASTLFVLVSLVCSAQVDPPPPPAPVPVGLPVDGGLIFLFTLGILYGIYKIFKFTRS